MFYVSKLYTKCMLCKQNLNFNDNFPQIVFFCLKNVCCDVQIWRRKGIDNSSRTFDINCNSDLTSGFYWNHVLWWKSWSQQFFSDVFHLFFQFISSSCCTGISKYFSRHIFILYLQHPKSWILEGEDTVDLLDPKISKNITGM